MPLIAPFGRVRTSSYLLSVRIELQGHARPQLSSGVVTRETNWHRNATSATSEAFPVPFLAGPWVIACSSDYAVASGLSVACSPTANVAIPSASIGPTPAGIHVMSDQTLPANNAETSYRANCTIQIISGSRVASSPSFHRAQGAAHELQQPGCLPTSYHAGCTARIVSSFISASPPVAVDPLTQSPAAFVPMIRRYSADGCSVTVPGLGFGETNSRAPILAPPVQRSCDAESSADGRDSQDGLQPRARQSKDRELRCAAPEKSRSIGSSMGRAEPAPAPMSALDRAFGVLPMAAATHGGASTAPPMAGRVEWTTPLRSLTAPPTPLQMASTEDGFVAALILLCLGATRLARRREAVSCFSRSSGHWDSGVVCLGDSGVVLLVVLVTLLAAPGTLAVTAITNANVGTAVTAWLTSPTSATTTYGDVAGWNTAAVSNMIGLFYPSSTARPTFNGDISKWNTASVSTMESVSFVASHACGIMRLKSGSIALERRAIGRQALGCACLL